MVSMQMSASSLSPMLPTGGGQGDMMQNQMNRMTMHTGGNGGQLMPNVLTGLTNPSMMSPMAGHLLQPNHMQNTQMPPTMSGHMMYGVGNQIMANPMMYDSSQHSSSAASYGFVQPKSEFAQSQMCSMQMQSQVSGGQVMPTPLLYNTQATATMLCPTNLSCSNNVNNESNVTKCDNQGGNVNAMSNNAITFSTSTNPQVFIPAVEQNSIPNSSTVAQSSSMGGDSSSSKQSETNNANQSLSTFQPIQGTLHQQVMAAATGSAAPSLSIPNSTLIGIVTNNASSASTACPIPPEMLNYVVSATTSGTGACTIVVDDRRTRRPFKPSTVWDHFLRLSDGNVQCIHCAKILKRKDSSTKTMWGHLRAIHFKGRDWTALQQVANAAAAVSKPQISSANSALPSSSSSSSMTLAVAVEQPEGEGADSNLIADGGLRGTTTQSWLEEQLGINSSGGTDSECTTEVKIEDSEDADGNSESASLKRDHSQSASEDGTPTQPYVKRNRASVSVPVSTSSCASTDAFTPAAPNSNSKFATNNNGLSAVRAALAQQQKSNEEKKTMNFLAMIPRSSEVINITAGFSGDEGKPPTANGAANSTLDENGEESGSFDSSGMVVSESRGTSSATVTGDVTPSVSSTSDQLQAAAILSAAASNPFMYMAAANALVANSMSEAPEKAASSFSLMDGECVATLMRVAVDLDCTFFFHCRGGQPHFCFEPNASAAERFNRGSELLLLDMENEIRIIERNGGVDVDSESWKKTDWTQFTWAIRGKCQKALLRR